VTAARRAVSHAHDVTSHRTHAAQPAHLLLALAAGVLAVLAVLAAPAPAAAAQPCWKQLISDWYDGRIDNSYPVSCYRAALDNLPDDVASYSSAREDIERALLNASRRNQAAPTSLIPPSVATGAPGSPRTQTGTSTPNGGTVTGDTAGTTETETETLGDEESEAADDDGLVGVFSPANADSVPLPLLVLAALALLLLGSAAVAFVARRVQARRVGLGPGDERLPLDP
jgi:hypothetical protein